MEKDVSDLHSVYNDAEKSSQPVDCNRQSKVIQLKVIKSKKK